MPKEECFKIAESIQNGIKHWGERRNRCLQAISPFPKVFLKDILQAHKKQGLVKEVVK